MRVSLSSLAKTILPIFRSLTTHRLDYDEGELLEWSGDIGSDISFFFSSGTAYCTGRGEIVRDMPPLLDAEYPILLLKPTSPLSTGAVYKALDVSKCSVTNPDELLERFYKEKPSQVSKA